MEIGCALFSFLKVRLKMSAKDRKKMNLVSGVFVILIMLGLLGLSESIPSTTRTYSSGETFSNHVVVISFLLVIFVGFVGLATSLFIGISREGQYINNDVISQINEGNGSVDDESVLGGIPEEWA